MKNKWNLTVLDSGIFSSRLNSMSVDDINGDGINEVVLGGEEELSWYCPNTFEKGFIQKGNLLSVGLVTDDIDNDDIAEIFASEFEKKTQ